MDKKLLGLNGVFAVFKPAGETSAKTVDRVKSALIKTVLLASAKASNTNSSQHHHQKRLSKQIKVGHGGTLDPMATGILVIGLNAGCKDLQKYLAGPKSYRAEGRFGEHFDTLDRTGKLLQVDEGWGEKVGGVEQVLGKFVGEVVMQVPPAFSAIHVNGKRAYDLARKESTTATTDTTTTAADTVEISSSSYGGTVDTLPVSTTSTSATVTPQKEASFDLPPRPVSINSLSYTPLSLPTFQLSVSCGGGCYIRSLIRDIAAEVGTLAHMTELERIRQGVFGLEMCLRGEEEWADLDLVEEAINKAKSLL